VPANFLHAQQIQHTTFGSIGLADTAWVHQLEQGGGIIADAVCHSLLSTAQLSPATMLLRK
jgi:hypothetical protein